MDGRIINRYEGTAPGPLLICIGGMHGNEPSGEEAIHEVFRLLEKEPAVNTAFQYRGALVGLRGNITAMRLQQRFIHRDLNRMLLEEEIERIQHSPEEMLSPEDRECIDLIQTIREEINQHQPPLTLILDLHTTTADGGIFTIAADDALSMTLAKGLHAPVILGIAEGLKGTTLHYFNRPDLQRYCIVFEAGQHNDPECVHRNVAAVINCMRSIGSLDPKDVDHRHDGLLKRMSTGLPKVTRLKYHYRIPPEEHFEMKPGYKNFQHVQKGEPIAKNERGIVHAPAEGLILMPKYQLQGDDGFFILEVVE